jgi:polysaccharide deacetylase 2 family uncharacterized protein YibQ
MLPHKGRMAAAAEPAEGMSASKSGRALAFASSFTVCLLAAGTLAITLLGRPHAPAITLELPETPGAKHHAPAQQQAVAEELPTQGKPITSVLRAGSALLADPALIENTSEGPLPRIADDGRRPMTAYAGPVPVSSRVKIAIVVSGLGLSASATQSALAGLPSGVTLGFAPYAGDVGEWVAKARGRGHEVLLEIPMEPFDFPDSDPGPHTLRSGQDEDANIRRLTWALTRFTGYAGVTNLLGQRFLGDSDALAPALTYLNRRGLYFFDNGAASQSVATTVSGQVGLPAASGTPLDAIPTALEIDRHLSELETSARANGGAVGSAFLYPVSVARIAAWAKGLESRGFVLVPVSALVNQKKQ